MWHFIIMRGQNSAQQWYSSEAYLLLAVMTLAFSLQCGTIQEQHNHIDDLAQDCSNSSALAMELLPSSTKPWLYQFQLNINDMIISCILPHMTNRSFCVFSLNKAFQY